MKKNDSHRKFNPAIAKERTRFPDMTQISVRKSVTYHQIHITFTLVVIFSKYIALCTIFTMSCTPAIHHIHHKNLQDVDAL